MEQSFLRDVEVDITSKMSSMGLTLGPAIHCHPGVSQAGWFMNVCAVHRKDVKLGVPSASIRWWMLKIAWCLSQVKAGSFLTVSTTCLSLVISLRSQKLLLEGCHLLLVATIHCTKLFTQAIQLSLHSGPMQGHLHKICATKCITIWYTRLNNNNKTLHV